WLWQLLDISPTKQTLAERLQSKFPFLADEQAVKDASVFLDDLLQHGMLVDSPLCSGENVLHASRLSLPCYQPGKMGSAFSELRAFLERPRHIGPGGDDLPPLAPSRRCEGS